MSLRLMIPGSPRAYGRNEESVLSLLRPAVTVLSASIGAVAYLWLFFSSNLSATQRPIPMWPDIAAPTVVLIAAGAALLWRKRVALSSSLLCLGLVAASYVWPSPYRYMAAPAIVCLSGLLVGRAAAPVAAVALSFLPGSPPEALVASWFAAATLWLAASYYYAGLNQALERQRHASLLEQELLSRREELRRLNDSLRNAYTLLERTNHELAQARDEAEEARRLKVQFAANISHELRTPLNLILGFTEVMHTTPESYDGATFTSELRGDVREVYENTRHLLELVDDVLDLSHIEQVRLALVPEESDIGELVRQAADTAGGLFRGKPVQLLLDLEQPLPSCTVDRTRIRQVLINLLTNAARFTERGEVTVKAVYDEPKREVVVSVADTGAGIAADERARIFEAFYQADSPAASPKGHGPARKAGAGGTGLGLAICKTFIGLHGGRIWVESEPGRGSCFSFTVPIRHHASSPEWKYQAAADPFGESVVLLGAETRAAHRLERSLGRIRVHSAADAPEARSLIEQWHPRAVVVVSMDGQAEADTGILRGVPACTGLPIVECRVQGAWALSDFGNVRSVLPKPVTAKALLEALDSVGPLRTVLLAEDDESMSRLLQRTISLARPGLEVLTAYDGRQALARLRSRRPDALLLDLAMPHMSGIDVLRAMAEGDLARVPVIVLTGMELAGEGGELAAERLVIDACGGLSEVDVLRLIGAVVETATPRYVQQPAVNTSSMPVAAVRCP